MWRLVLTVVLWHTISSQPVTDDPTRPTREVDFVECCPCPGSSRAGLQDLGTAGANGFSRAAGLDDCPCQLRDADSEGSSSVFLPRAVRPVRPLVTPEAAKEDLKPLLKPEVGLASSVLETLKEVTDEEYQEALARDAARNAARVAELADAQPETAKNVVTIIVNPRDAIPEASQAVETHCAPPLSSLGQVRKDKPSIFKLGHNFRNLQDMDNGASEVKQSVVGLNQGLDGLRLKTTPSLLKLFPQRKSEGNIQSLLKLKQSKESGTSNLDGIKPKLPKRKLGSIFRKVGEGESSIKPLKPLSLVDISKLKIPKLRTNFARNPSTDDSNQSPSIIQEFSVPFEKKPKLVLKTVLPQTPFNLANFLNLKDVELIPPKSTKITLPDLKQLFPPLRVNKLDTTFVKKRKSQGLTKKCNNEGKENEEDTGLQKNRGIHTEILDTIPHASVITPVIAVNNAGSTTDSTSNINVIAKKNKVKTEILDALPSASETNEFINENESQIETSTPRLEDETTNSDGDLEPPNFEETVTVPTNKISKDNIQKFDSNENKEKFILNNGENEKFQQFAIAQEENQPISEIDIADSALDGEDLNLEINEEEDGAPGLTFSTDGSESITIEELIEGGFASDPIEQNQEVIDLDFNPELEFNPEQEFEESQGFETESAQQNEEQILFRQDLSADPSNQNIQLESLEELQGFDTELEQQNEEDILFRQDSSAETSNQNIQLASLERTVDRNDNYLFRQDLAADTSKQNIQLESSEHTDERNFNNEPAETLGSVELPLQSKETTPTSDLLSSLKQRISIKLNSLKSPGTKITISRIGKPVSEKNSFNSEEFSVLEPLTEDNEKFIVDEKSAEMSTSKSPQVNMQDLQDMSDSLLIKSEKRILSELCQESEGQTQMSDAAANTMQLKTLSAQGNNVDEKNNSDMDSSATSFRETFDTNVPNHDDFSVIDESSTNNDGVVARTDIDDMKTYKKEVNINTCLPNFEHTKSVTESEKDSFSLNSRNNGETEMETGASETVFNTAKMPTSPFLHQSIVVQPASLFPPIPTLDLSTVNLPTLDDITDGISNLLGENSRASADETTNLDSEECLDSNPMMSSDASTKNMKSAFPALRPLEDINLDIFQINPQSLGSPLSKLPSLNLNSFRTKLPLPKSLELKPMKLQSALGGKNGGLLGASLTLGPNKATSRKAKPITNLGSILNLQGSDILHSPLSNIPSLDDLRETMRANTGSLLSLTSPLEDTLKTSQAFGNSLRSHTENTMRNLQQSLSSTLNVARTNNAGEKFAKPQDLLEKVALAHEDVKDKLHGLHVDLQDRLSSIHDDILGQTNFQIPTLQTPLLSSLGRLQESPFSSFRASNDFKKTPNPKLLVKKRKPTVKVNKPLSKPKEQNKVKPFKISKAASSLTPKSVEVPKLMATSIKPPFLRPLQRDENVKLKVKKPLFANADQKMQNKKSFGMQGKVTKGTSLRPATEKSNPTRPRFSPKSSVTNNQQSRLGAQRMSPFKSFSDSRGYASEPQAKKVPAPFKPLSSAEFLSSGVSREELQAKSSSPIQLPDFALKNPLLSRTSPKLEAISQIKLPSLKPTLASLTLSKPTESPIVSKMRDAIRIRLSRPVKSSNKSRNDAVSKSHDKEALTGSASEAKGVAVRIEPMKENVSYKCKMVCVRD